MILATICTSNRESVIRDAVTSALGIVDGFVIVDLGITDGTVDAVRSFGLPVHVVKHPWRDDMAAARNAGLDGARALLARWACILDTDERLDANGEDLHKALAQPVECWQAADADEGYKKVRFVRLRNDDGTPARPRYYRRAWHERFDVTDRDPVLERFRFRELAKTPEQYRERDEYVVRCATRDIGTGPVDPDVYLYRGHSLLALGRNDAALRDFNVLRAMRAGKEAPVELVATATWMAAEAQVALDMLPEAVQTASRGLILRPDMPEFPYIAAVACVRMGYAPEALCWAKMAVVHGRFRGDGEQYVRLGHMRMDAAWEGPWNVIAWAEDALGRPEAAEGARQMAQRAAKRGKP